MASGAFEAFGNNIDSVVSKFAEDMSTALIGELGPLVLTACTLYFTLKGWMFLTGRAQGAIPDTMISAFKISLIAFFAMNSGNFTSFILGGLSSVDSMLSHVLSGADSSFGSIDVFWDKANQQSMEMMKWIGTAFGDAINPFSDRTIKEAIFLWLLVLLVLLGIIVLTLVSLASFIFCKIGLSTVLGFGPLFLCTLMFPVTRSWFDGWLKTCLSMIIATTIVASILSLSSNLFDSFIQRLGEHVHKEPGLGEFGNLLYDVMILFFCLMSVAFLLRQIPSIATSLVGGVALSTPGMISFLSGKKDGKKDTDEKQNSIYSALPINSAQSTSGGALSDIRANRALTSSSSVPLLSHNPQAKARVLNIGGPSSSPPAGGGKVAIAKEAIRVGADKIKGMAYSAYGIDKNGDAVFASEIRKQSARSSRKLNAAA